MTWHGHLRLLALSLLALSLLALSVAAQALLISSAAAQDPPRAQTFALNWVRAPGAETCIASHALARIMQSAYGPLFGAPDQADLAIEGFIAPRALGRWHARIAISDRQGRVLGVRELESPNASCRALDAQVLLVIALAIDPEVALRGLPQELLEQLGAPTDAADELLAELRAQEHAASSQQAASGPAAVAAVHPQAEPQQTEPLEPAPTTPPSPMRVQLLAQLGLARELLPDSTAALGASAELLLTRRLSLAASAASLLPVQRSVPSPNAAQASVRFDLTLVALNACVAPLLLDDFRLSVCAGAGALVRSSTPHGLRNASQRSHLDGSGLLGTTLVYTGVRPLVLAVGASLHAPLRRLRYSYSTPGALGRSILVTTDSRALLIWLGLGVEL